MTDDRDNRSLFIPPSTQDHIQGVLNAAVVFVMYGDYECFQSANVYRLIKVAQQQLRVSFGENNLNFIFRHFPQVQIHPHAQRAEEARRFLQTGGVDILRMMNHPERAMAHSHHHHRDQM